MKLAILAVVATTVAAFTAPINTQQTSKTCLAATDSRREFFSAATAAVVGGAALATGVAPANAIRDYENLGYLGGGQIVDVNNANVRVYLKMPGMYPGAAGKIVSHGPYSSVKDLYAIPNITEGEKTIIKKYEARFVALKPSADFVIDRINNGLYR